MSKIPIELANQLSKDLRAGIVAALTDSGIPVASMDFDGQYDIIIHVEHSMQTFRKTRNRYVTRWRVHSRLLSNRGDRKQYGSLIRNGKVKAQKRSEAERAASQEILTTTPDAASTQMKEYLLVR